MVPSSMHTVTSNHIFKRRKKGKGEAGLVNKHIFWRSAGGNELEGQGYEFMTAYDTIVSMGAESMPVPV